MDNYILRELNSNKLINCIDDKIHYANHIGSTIKFPTYSEADYYLKDNGLAWYNFGIERA